MCGSATLAIVLSTPCMIVASVSEAVISARLSAGARLSAPHDAPGLAGHYSAGSGVGCNPRRVRPAPMNSTISAAPMHISPETTKASR